MLETLPDEILDIVFLLCREHAAFVALVCTRMWRTEKRNRNGPTRRCAVHSAFESMETLNYALGQNQFASFVQTKKLEWTAMAKNAAFRNGDIEVVMSICTELTMDPGLTMTHIARWNRMDVFLDPMNSFMVDWVDAMIVKFVSPPRLLSKVVCSAKRLVTCVIVPALCGGSIDVLDWVFSNLRRRRLSRDCVWNLLISGEGSSTPSLLALAASTAENASCSLEYVCELLVEAVSKYSMETVRRHVAAVGLIMSKSGVSASALEWCKKRAPSLSTLVHNFNEDVDNGISVVPVRQVYLSVGRACFRPRLVTSYRFFQRETKCGGWMHKAFHDLEGYETSCMEWETLSVMNSTSFGDLDTAEKCSIAVASMEDCFASWVQQSIPTRDALCRQMSALSDKSVYASYTVARRVLLPQQRSVSATGCPVPDATHHIFYGKGSVLYTILLKAVYTGLVAVVKDMLSPGFDVGTHLNSAQHDNVLTVALHKDNELMTDALLASGKFSPTSFMVLQAASQQRANFLKVALRFNTDLAHSDIGQAAYTTRDPCTINVAMGNKCFPPGSALETSAMFILADSSSHMAKATARAKKRKLRTEFLLGPLLRDCQSKA
jgi:hypothetical protein